LSLGNKILNRGPYRLGPGGHENNYVLGIRGAEIVEEMVLASGESCEAVHGFLDNGGYCLVEPVHCFTSGEVDIRVLGRTPHHRPIRGKTALAVFDDQLVIDHGPHVIF